MEGVLDKALHVLIVIIIVWAAWFILRPHARPIMRSVAILVLGDIGRSPRMMYHAESFATNGFQTFIVGYSGMPISVLVADVCSHARNLGSKPIPSLLSIPDVRFLYLSSPPSYLSSLPFIISAPCKVFHQVISILHTLVVRIAHPPEFIVVQVRVYSFTQSRVRPE